MAKTLIIRADATNVIGTGHVMRCLTLANELASRGWSVFFLMRSPNVNIVEAIKRAGHSVKLLGQRKQSAPDGAKTPPYTFWLNVSQEVDASETSKIVSELNANWVVVDHYALDQTWHRIVKKNCKNILVIDDLANRQLDCSILLDQNLGASKHTYRKQVVSNCLYLMGPHYALLRREFQLWRSHSILRRAKGPIKDILITMGGVDASNYTLNILNQLEQSNFAEECNFHVVIGSSFPYKNKLENFIKSSRLSISMMSDINNMAELMARSDLCVGAAGSTSWERCCLGLPTLTLSIAQNQNKIADALEQGGIIIKSTLQTIRPDFDKIMKKENPKQLKKLIDNSIAVCDGHGVSRVVYHMEHINENNDT